LRRQSGFTLVEVLIAVAIVAALASIALPLAELQVQRQRERDLRQALREVREAIDAYKRAYDEGRIERSLDKSGFPPTLLALVDGVTDAKNPKSAKLYFLRRVPRDPFAADPQAPAHESWGLRASTSPADEPRAGADVFDIYSLKPGAGMNGVPYKQW
jgi:general secretion pathway protein G